MSNPARLDTFFNRRFFGMSERLIEVVLQREAKDGRGPLRWVGERLPSATTRHSQPPVNSSSTLGMTTTNFPAPVAALLEKGDCSGPVTERARSTLI
jgi:hypothetical protein